MVVQRMAHPVEHHGEAGLPVSGAEDVRGVHETQTRHPMAGAYKGFSQAEGVLPHAVRNLGRVPGGAALLLYCVLRRTIVNTICRSGVKQH